MICHGRLIFSSRCSFDLLAGPSVPGEGNSGPQPTGFYEKGALFARVLTSCRGWDYTAAMPYPKGKSLPGWGVEIRPGFSPLIFEIRYRGKPQNPLEYIQGARKSPLNRLELPCKNEKRRGGGKAGFRGIFFLSVFLSLYFYFAKLTVTRRSKKPGPETNNSMLFEGSVEKEEYPL